MEKIKVIIIATSLILGTVIIGILLAVGLEATFMKIHEWSQAPDIDNLDDCSSYIYSNLNPERGAAFEVRNKQFEACKILFPEEKTD